MATAAISATVKSACWHRVPDVLSARRRLRQSCSAPLALRIERVGPENRKLTFP
jgi:hypothetical protein